MNSLNTLNDVLADPPNLPDNACSVEEAVRDTIGRYAPGQSGNPGGRPRVVGHVRDLAQKHAEDAIATLATIMRQDDAPPSARIAAATALLDRGYGRPVDQKAMVLLSQNSYDLTAVAEMPMAQLVGEAKRLGIVF